MAVIEKTWTVASRGTGLPDYSAPQPTGGQITVGSPYTLADLAEGAARLGSIVTYDRRGEVVVLDDFESTVLKWDIGTAIGTEYARLDSTSVRSGSQAVRLHTPDTAGAAITISKGIPILVSKRQGYEISFSKLATSIDFFLDIIYHTGEVYYYAGFKLDTTTQKIYVRDSVGGYKEVADIGYLHETDFLFFNVKLVVDFDTQKYVRLLFNIYEYDISDIFFGTFPSGVAPYIHADYTLSNQDGDGGDVWLDDFIITQREPLNPK